MNANGPAAAQARSDAFHFRMRVAEVEHLAKVKLKFSSEGEFSTDPFAFICGSILFDSPPFAATVTRLLTAEAAQRQ
jgi:hypothetical protein